ncbi:hypothetical protein BU23DRAFT_539098 [Bimuria novae-zelandiae CBS 107.79]|uniref:Glycosyl transferase CAP10 domain-containing protein n=1 Tax=Bimuria novae-zelandiae CBS 107.79 TaxID=1447943 RepID=A0A6A5V3Z0_9PLEO|nr:hypothetical protein BU23DRAFT_539098 [Bimuria novae-zelandiae CBS 107.79]
MPPSNIIGPESVRTSITLALAFTFISDLLFTQPSELWSELGCWTLLPLIFKATNGQGSQYDSGVNRTQKRSLRALWAFAIGFGTFSAFKAEFGEIVLYPALVPLLLTAQLILGTDTFPSANCKWLSASFAWSSAALAVFMILVLPYEGIWRSALSTIPIAAQCLVLTLLLPNDHTKPRYLPHLQGFREVISVLALRVILVLVVLICLQTLVLGSTTDGLGRTSLLAVCKALSWYFTSESATHTTWIIAPMIHTAALLTSTNALHRFFQPHTVLHMFLPHFSVAEMILLLKKQSRQCQSLLFLLVLPLIPVIANSWAGQVATLDARSTYADLVDHPIERKFQIGRQQLQTLLQGQSSTYDAAVEEYRRRYNTDPVPGFEAWYNYSISHNSRIIDDFSVMYDSIAPLWQLSGQQIIHMTESAYAKPGSELWLCDFESENGRISCKHPWRSFDRNIELSFNQYLGGLKGAIPNVRFLVNHLDEPRVLRLVSWQKTIPAFVNLTVMSHLPTWNAITATCRLLPYPSNLSDDNDGNTSGLPFITSHAASLDLCKNPEYRSTHGLLQSPTSFRLLSGFIPILSTGAPSTMGDILFPSPAYIENEFQYKKEKDIPWDKKINEVYWRGSTTGGYANDGNWRNFHRQRFVTLAQDLQQRYHVYLRNREGFLRLVRSSFIDRQFFNVAFTRIFQCQMEYCRAQRMFFRTKPWADKNRALQSRLAFDMDGNGISGRFYQLLASQSVPLKQTLLREWHDDRLIPWVHYIPVSQSMEELPELVSYLILSGMGQSRAKEIADQGRKWFSEAFREVDMSIYLYRPLLELARLQDPPREASVKR